MRIDVVEAVLIERDHREGDAGGRQHVGRFIGVGLALPQPVMAAFIVAGAVPTSGRQRDEIDAVFVVFVDGDKIR